MKRSYMIHVFLLAHGYKVVNNNPTGKNTKYHKDGFNRFTYVSKSKGSVRRGLTLKDSFSAEVYPTADLERWISSHPELVMIHTPEVIDVIGVY